MILVIADVMTVYLPKLNPSNFHQQNDCNFWVIISHTIFIGSYIQHKNVGSFPQRWKIVDKHCKMFSENIIVKSMRNHSGLLTCQLFLNYLDHYKIIITCFTCKKYFFYNI